MARAELVDPDYIEAGYYASYQIGAIEFNVTAEPELDLEATAELKIELETTGEAF